MPHSLIACVQRLLFSPVQLFSSPLRLSSRLAYLWMGKRWILLNRLGVFVEQALKIEDANRRLPLWLPVAALSGVLLFFAAGQNPTLFQSFAFLGMSMLAAFLLRAHGSWFAAAMLVVMVAAGFTSATVRTAMVVAPKLERPMWLTVEGVVRQVDKRPRGSRIVLDVQQIDRLKPEQWPRRVRVNLPSRYAFETGEQVNVNAFWFPPYAASRPGGYDFARTAFFNELGAVGTRVRSAERLGHADQADWGMRFRAGVETVRNAIAVRIQSVLPKGDARAITIALVNGQRGEISKQADEHLRLAGLYHVISISGLHMALFAGAVFLAVRLGGVLLPTVAERYAVRSFAAVVASVAALGYLLISGSDIPAVRSFLMVALVFLAMVVGRAAITQRNLALSAALVILVAPEAVLGPSFQMSFAAVMLLVAWYEPRTGTVEKRQTAKPPKRVFLVSWFWKAFWVAVITTVLATLATSPYAAYHFQRFAPYALAGNLLASPLVGVVIMPAALVGLVLMPVGLDGWAWHVMAWGVQRMLDISAWVAGWPEADILVPAFSVPALLLFTFGMVWVALWVSALRWLGLMPMLAGFVLALMPQKMDFYIAPNGGGMAMRHPDGRLRLVGTRAYGLEAESWLLADGDTRKIKDASLKGDVWCDRVGCTAPVPFGARVSYVWSVAAFNEDCGKAALMVSRLKAPAICADKTVVLDEARLQGRGAVSGYFDGDGQIHLFYAQPAGTARFWYSP